ncbi:transposase [Poseidonibacter lekithochrous]|uniref:transposase n=1 Tax=Poseidonibacter TaxID=2321187 RepID=UPI001C0A28FA|nr:MULTISPECIES: transposase [Poseidonibacter]MBU3014725.1 transposase [Poseidonibacter lekithochrous]MDO6828023.1 IS1182 family transposase [Poseidonibacter sp. 1_MG-2023]
MPNYKEGLNRHQQLLFPPSIDEYVDENNPVRAIDSYVDSIDLSTLGVFTCNGGSEGQPAYHPALLLKIYLYGYLNSIRSSRKLEREIKRNIEMMWLCMGLSPGYKTIANFRKDNPKVLKQLFRDFVILCRSVDLIDGEVVAIDGKYKFIVATDISTKGIDLDQLYPLSIQAKEATGNKKIKVAADAGYYNPKEIKKCVDEGIDVYVPIQDKQKQQKDKGKFTRDAFVYDEAKDCYICPNHEILKRKETIYERNGIKRFMYRNVNSVCKVCSIRQQCLPNTTPAKRLWRWEHESLIDTHRTKMQTRKAKTMIKQRAALAEHPFGTIKQKLGWSHFLVRGKTKVAGENALIMLTYNFRRLLNLIGIKLFQKLIKGIKSGNIEDIKQEIAEYIAVLVFFRAFFRQKVSLYI